MNPLLPIERARETLDAHAPKPRVERIDLEGALGRILAKDIRADRDVPPFDRAAVDGFAIRLDGPWKPGSEFAVVARIMAGESSRRVLRPGTAAQVMTGAPVPKGSDGMVMVERSAWISPDRVRLEGAFDVARRPGIAPRGQDARRGSTVLGAGTLLRPSDLSILAGVGATPVGVTERPSVEILTTGNEIVAPTERPTPSQIRNSNGPFLVSLLSSSGWVDSVRERWVPDLPGRIRRRIDASPARILIFTGGVSMGEKDFVPDVLRECGYRLRFHRVALKPGKPVLFASKGSGRNMQFAFGLPGNPVSVAVTAWEFLLPFLRRTVGCPTPGPVDREFTFRAAVGRKPGLTHFVPVRVHGGHAEVCPMNGSGDYLALADVDGFLVLDSVHPEVAAGSNGVVHLLREEPQPRPRIREGRE